MNTHLSFAAAWRALAFTGMLLASAPFALAQDAAGTSKGCPETKSGLKLPPGFCATIFADSIGHARHMVVAPDGVVYVNTWSGAYYDKSKLPDGGFLVALQDTKGTGHADVTQRFGETVATGGAGGTGIGLYKGFLYAEINDRIVRYAMQPGAIVPEGNPEVVVSGMPLGGDHPMHPFAIDADGMMYVDMGSATNSCQEKNRTLKSPGIDPCVELQTRGGIWRYDANKTDQKFSPAERYATGIRNAVGITIDPSGHGVYSTQHGRDQLGQNWPDLYKPEQGVILPSEVLLHESQGGDFGWPECYYDPIQGKLVLAPEYGGDGGKKLGVCAGKLGPVAAFPAHWGPDSLLFYTAKEFPAHYRNGVFIAFHGSWNRAPFPQSGYNVAFQPLNNGVKSAKCEVFADGFAGVTKTPEKAAHRPTGLAMAADGSLYVSDDQAGRIYRIVYTGPAGDNPTHFTPCPSETEAGTISAATDGTSTDAGAAALPVPKGATKAMVALGGRIYSGQVGGASCTGCHGADATGSALGPNLTDTTWLWSDGSFAGIRKTITEGVANPKEFRSPMPAMGGTQLTRDQVAATAAYVWALSHHDTH